MKIKDYNTYKDYFQEIADSHVDVNSFYHGDIEKLMDAMRSEITYPALWLDPYETAIQDGLSDNFIGRARGSIVVMSKPSDDLPEDDIERNSEIIIKDIISKILYDYNAGELYTRFSDFRYTTIDPQFTDRVRGVRLEFSFDLPLGLTFNEAKWQ